MPFLNLITPIAIYLLVPLVGVAVFLMLCGRMRRAGIPSPPFVPCFILFGVFGGWLLVLLTALFWEWSGMASIGVLSLALVAPFVTMMAAASLRSRRRVSGYHRGAFAVSIGYSAWMPGMVLLWFCLGYFSK